MGIVLIIVKFILAADDRLDREAVSSSGAAEDRIGPVARDLGKEFLTVAEDRGGIDLMVVRIEEVASASPDQRDCVALRSIPVGQFHKGKVWKLAIYVNQKYLHGINSRVGGRANGERNASLTRGVASR